MKKVCLIGAPGVGKTTIYKKLFENIKSTEFIKAEKIRLLIRRQNTKIILNSYSKAGMYFEKFKIYNSVTGIMKRGQLKEIEKECFSKMRDTYSDISDIAYKGLNNLEVDPVSRMLGAEYFNKLLKTETIVDCIESFKIAILDDSVWQSLKGDIFVLEESSAGIQMPCAVIYFYNASERILRQIKDRARKGKINTIHYGLTDKELVKMIAFDIENAERKKEYFLKLHIPVLIINTNNNTDDNILIIEKYLNSMSSII